MKDILEFYAAVILVFFAIIFSDDIAGMIMYPFQPSRPRIVVNDLKKELKTFPFLVLPLYLSRRKSRHIPPE